MRPAAAPLFALALFAAPAAAGTPQVVTDLPAVHALAARVMAGVGSPAILLDQGADPHSFQLRPSQARALAAADLVLWVGPELTPWLERALEGTGGAARAVALLRAEGVTQRPYGAGHVGEDHGHGDGEEHGNGHDHADDPDHAHGHEHADDHAHGDGEGHDHGGADPHAWLDPANARAWVAAIAAELARADAANAVRYAANAAAATAEIDAMEAEVRAILAPVGTTPVLVFHDAYAHFAAAFGLNVAGTIALGDAAAPGAARLAETRALIAALGPVCVFPEVQHDVRLAEVAIEGTPARLGAPLDPEGTSLDFGPGLYAALLKGLATAIADCVAGG